MRLALPTVPPVSLVSPVPPVSPVPLVSPVSLVPQVSQICLCGSHSHQSHKSACAARTPTNSKFRIQISKFSSYGSHSHQFKIQNSEFKILLLRLAPNLLQLIIHHSNLLKFPTPIKPVLQYRH